MARRRHKWKKALLETMDLPMETENDVCKITIVGMCDMLVENHRGILKYTENELKLSLNEGTLHICGEQLVLLELGTERAYIRGKIKDCGFENGV